VADWFPSRRGADWITGGAPPGIPDKPDLPLDIVGSKEIIEFIERNALAYRENRDSRQSRAALIAILSVEQYAQLYHYGFVEQRGRSGKLYRIHWHRGNNVSVFQPGDKCASTGLSCFVMSECFDDTVISNILALRTDEDKFCRTACNEPTFESKVDYSYGRLSFL